MLVQPFYSFVNPANQNDINRRLQHIVRLIQIYFLFSYFFFFFSFLNVFVIDGKFHVRRWPVLFRALISLLGQPVRDCISLTFRALYLSRNSSFVEQSGAVEACWAHNPEVRGSKPRSANLLVVKIQNKVSLSSKTNIASCVVKAFQFSSIAVRLRHVKYSQQDFLCV